MAVNMYTVSILSFCLFFCIRGLAVCEDKSTDCQPCNLQYPVPTPTRENCMKTCQVCTDDKNIALNQITKQSSTAHEGNSSRAVDGNPNGDYGHGSCTHTENTGTQWWCVDLKKIFNIKNLTMYNRDYTTADRLMGFELKTSSSGQCNEAGFTTSSLCYKNDPPTNQRVYTIDRCNQDSNKSIVAGTLFVLVTGVSLTICEVQVFTEISCSHGYYSTSSSSCKPCDGCSDNKCNPDTGDCIGVCKSGFYGTKCQQKCSEGCENKECTRLDGSCSCINGWFGPRCQLQCNTGCKDNVCDQDGGRCSEGCITGQYGDQCDKACSQDCSTPDCRRDGSCTVCKPGWYGDNCESRCPTGCKETCNKNTDIYGECKEGTVRPYCDYSINPVTASSISGIVGLILGVAVTGLICWLCCIRRRQPGDQQDTRTDQRRHNNSISTNQPSTIIQNETFLSYQQTNTYDTLDHTAVQNDTYINAYSSLSNK